MKTTILLLILSTLASARIDINECIYSKIDDIIIKIWIQ